MNITEKRETDKITFNVRSVESGVLDQSGIKALEAGASVAAANPAVPALESARRARPVALVRPSEVGDDVGRRQLAVIVIALINVHPRDGHVDAQQSVQPL